VAFEDVEKHFSPEKFKMMICMGYSKMNTVRELKFAQAKEKGYQILGYRHSTAIVLSDDIDPTNIIMEGVIIGQGCKVGTGNVFWPMAHVAHDTTVGNYNFFTISCSIAGNIKIGNNCIFGNNCTIKNGVKIEDYALIGAGAYISHDVEAESVYVPPRSYRLEEKKSWDFKL
jgi:acetyltransferase-like isoleucine patch superfamily enzyme